MLGQKMIKLPNFLILFSCILPSIITSQKLSNCDQSCPGGIFNRVSYPFGFSSACQIQLNCTSNGTVLIGKFPVRQINSNELLISLPTNCGRSADALNFLYGEHYAPTSTSSILMENCTNQMMNCRIPLPITQFRTAITQLVNCSNDHYGNTNCYSSDASNSMFLDYYNVTKMGCRFLLSGFVMERIDLVGGPPSYTQAVKLAWWLKGTCDCSDGADCTKILSPTDGSDGYRCMCKSGFKGDGYKASSGCQKLKGPKGAAHSRNLRLIIGFSCSIAGIILLLIVIKYRLGESHKSADRQIELFVSNYGALASKRFNYSEIKKLTKSFQEKLGEGGYGSVYKGELPHGQLVAVKVLTEASEDGEEFINEVASIGRTSHVNVVTLLGFCIEGKKRALIYEFMPNGSLDKFLHGDDSLLNWSTLFEIAKGIARGLEYLHNGSNTRIVHFDIKPHNILLDEEFVPKISDFGLAKLCKKKESIVSLTGARGTAGYMAPEVFFKSHEGASHKSDVYSYGMMVLEMTGARRNYNANTTSVGESDFLDWIYKQVETEGSLGDYGVTTKAEEELAKKMVIVSLWSILSDPSDRPSISKVLEMLEGSCQSLNVPPRHFWSSSKTPAQGTSSSATPSPSTERVFTLQATQDNFSS